MITSKLQKKNLNSWILMMLATVQLFVVVVAHAATKEANTKEATKTETAKLVEATTCNDVDIQEVRSLQFGLLRVRTGVGGWAIVDAGGGVKVSPGIAFSHRYPPSAGAVQVTAPPNTEIAIGIELIGNASVGPLTMAQPMAVSETGMYGLKRSGRFWILRMPNSDKATVSVDIAIGGQLIIQAIDKRWDLKTKIVAQCVSARTVLPP